jgi:hypothetical protein
MKKIAIILTNVHRSWHRYHRSESARWIAAFEPQSSCAAAA